MKFLLDRYDDFMTHNILTKIVNHSIIYTSELRYLFNLRNRIARMSLSDLTPGNCNLYAEVYGKLCVINDLLNIGGGTNEKMD